MADFVFMSIFTLLWIFSEKEIDHFLYRLLVFEHAYAKLVVFIDRTSFRTLKLSFFQKI